MPETETAAVETPPVETPPAETEAVDYRAKFEAEREHSRKWEARAKENKEAAKALEDFKTAQMTETEKAIEAAKQETRNATLREVGSRLVDAEIKALAAKTTLDVEAVLEGLDRTRFLTEDGDPDSEAIAKWVERIAPAESKPEFPDIGQGKTGPSEDPMISAFKRGAGLTA